MGRNTFSWKIVMDNLNKDLNLLENLSKKISDLLYNDEFSQITVIDNQRKALIKKIKENHAKENYIKARINELVDNNNVMISNLEKKINKLSKNHNNFRKRLKAYSFNR